ncbi:uncharacterized protein ATNIH1004_007199 [Aspergillus tanneri]|nr:uncharacterized protein ATNIH1004_007199 [Aspergillus tanneri]KAA8645779.1 hypothetical protein ATNIH1004_007199 [Aspergillus tanneri]
MSLPVAFEPFLLSSLEHYLVVAGIGSYGCNYFIFRTENTDDALSTLNTGVTRLVQELPFLAGEVAPVAGDSRRRLEVRPSSIDVFEKCPMLVVREVNSPLPASDFGRTIDAAGDNAYRPLPPKPDGPFQPVLRFQANMFHGGIVLCFCWNHLLIDGTAVSNVIQMLASCCRAETSVSLKSIRQQQDLGRKIISDIIERPLPEKMSADDESFVLHNLEEVATESIARETMQFSPRRIDELKTACNERLSVGQYCTTNDILMALYWIIGARASIAHGKRFLAISFAVSMAKRCRPSLPDSYIGSTLVLQSVQGNQHEIVDALSTIDSNPSSIPDAYTPLLAKLATQIRAKILATDDQHLTRTIHELYEMSQWNPGQGKGDLLFSNLSFNGCYKQDFGPVLGPVVGFEPRTVYPNMAYLKPRRPVGTGLGPWELTLMFDPKRLEMMKNDPLLVWAST